MMSLGIKTYKAHKCEAKNKNKPRVFFVLNFKAKNYAHQFLQAPAYGDFLQIPKKCLVSFVSARPDYTNMCNHLGCYMSFIDQSQHEKHAKKPELFLGVLNIPLRVRSIFY